VNAETIAVGSELLTPFRQDTNSLYLTRRLNDLGVEVGFKTIVGDSREHIRDAIRTALWRTGIVILTGGLGPTEDDLTRDAVAAALGVELYRDPDLIAKLYARFASRQIKSASATWCAAPWCCPTRGGPRRDSGSKPGLKGSLAS